MEFANKARGAYDRFRDIKAGAEMMIPDPRHPLGIVERGLESVPGVPPLRLQEERARLLVDLQRIDEAKEAFAEILQSHPGHQPAREFLEQHAPELLETNSDSPQAAEEPSR